MTNLIASIFLVFLCCSSASNNRFVLNDSTEQFNPVEHEQSQVNTDKSKRDPEEKIGSNDDSERIALIDMILSFIVLSIMFGPFRALKFLVCTYVLNYLASYFYIWLFCAFIGVVVLIVLIFQILSMYLDTLQ